MLIALLFAAGSALASVPTFVDDPVQLRALEGKGFDFGRLVLGASAPVSDSAGLVKLQAFGGVVERVRKQLSDLKWKDFSLGTTMRYRHRLFNGEWLTSKRSFYELVGVVQRLDRGPFEPGHCGEFRFIYRLAYRTPDGVYSRLPLTWNAVFWAQGDGKDCREAARTWSEFREALNPASLKLGPLKSLELNVQSVRWPSTIRPDMGGYAEYFLRVFRKNGESFEPAPLENTPDAAWIQLQPALRAKLLAWIRDPVNLRAIDQGIARMPDEFLATEVTSVALHGPHRLANAPFHRIFDAKEFGGLAFSGLRTIRSPQGLLRRLEDLSCVGCHQGRTVAGFHFLGKDRPETDAVNAIAVSASPHFLLDQPRREKYFESVLGARHPELFRPLSVRSEIGEGGVGSHCGLGDPSFESWSCAPGFRCQKLIDDSRVSSTGVCQPVRLLAGSACVLGENRPSQNPHLDGITEAGLLDCGDARVCEARSVGFPSGMCSGRCRALSPGESCGSIAILQGFNDCLARGRTPFAKCLGENIRPATLGACDDRGQFCRDDYICARAEGGKGGCIPPYFLFQLRLDGHPPPG